MNHKETLQMIEDHFNNITPKQFEQNLRECGFYDDEVKIKKIPVKDKKTGKVYYLDWTYKGKYNGLEIKEEK